MKLCLTVMRLNATSICVSVVLIVLFSAAAASQDQPQTIRGPILGFLADSRNETIRPLLGIPGASLLGHPIALDHPVRNAAISPDQNWALAVMDGIEETALIRFHPDSISLHALEQVHPGTDVIAISPRGGSAAVYDHESGVFQSLAITETPEVLFKLDASSIRGRLAGMAIADDGQAAILTFAEDDHLSAWLVTSDGDRWLVPAQQPTATVFLPNSHELVIADSSLREIFLLTGTPPSTPVSLASLAESTSISGLATTDDGKRVFAIQDAAGVMIIDAESRTSMTLPCGCNLTGLHRLSGQAVFRLSNPSDGPIAVLDASIPEPRVVIIPAEVVQ